MAASIGELDLAVIRQAPLFSRLPQSTLNQLLAGASIRTVTRGELLFVQGDPVAFFYVVLEGWVKIYRLTSAGGEAVVAVFTRGQSFAEAAAFVGGRYPASGEAVTDGRLLRIQSGHLLKLIRENPDIGLSMLASTSMHLQMLVQQIEQLKAHTGAQRVAEFLSSLCTGDASSRINLPYDKVLIAGRLGMQPESLSRAFTRLKPLGVHIVHNTAVIDDVGKLRQFVEEERGGGA
ncbi:MAG: Crp/Fnr family transcriptional regulator [Hyphomicrobiales bacterium]